MAIKGLFGKKRRPIDPMGDILKPVGIGDGQQEIIYGNGSGTIDSMSQPEDQKMPSFFQRDSTKAGFATFADTLVKLRSGVDPGLMRGIQQQGAIKAQQQQAEAKRYASNQDWQMKEDYKRNNPMPQKPNDFTRNMTAAGIDPTSEKAQALYLQRVQNQADPMQTVNNGDGTYSFVRPSQMRQRQGQGAPATGTVKGGYRFRGGNPNDKNNWEKVGGQASASGNFQP